MKLRCLAVDDESPARKLLEENIRQIPFLELVGTCKNAFEAMEVLQREKIDLLFLDIQMPGMLGTKFLSSLRDKPMVIFVTAYSNYAVESYELDVIDYLMKPVSLERFAKAAYKALDVATKNQPLPPVTPVSTPVVSSSAVPGAFFVNVEYSLVKIVVADISHIEGMKDYVKIFLTSAPKPVLTKSTLKAIEEKLPPTGFMRVHKSYIVNLSKIESIRSRQIMIGKYEIPVSETLLEELLRTIN
ncbi:MAG: LytTR family DNA-binding domain-containing protein [Bacteroidia bacterium]|nr:LytTR family DNA-binding domain-containing protein [Bacteroidia bacterium]